MRLQNVLKIYMESVSLLEIEVVYALPRIQFRYCVKIPFDSSVRDAIIASGFLSRFDHLELNSLSVGIFSKVVTLETILKPHDRIEIYRPLVASPKKLRKLRANKSKLTSP